MIIGIIVILGLALLILGHEAGHFIMAKIFGMRVDEFGIGFPPRILAWRKGETEYSVNWLPLGGFVRITGENGEFGLKDGDTPPPTPKARKRYFSFQPAWRRVVVLLAGILMNLFLGWLCFTVVFAVGTPLALLIQDVQPGSPAAIAGIEAGDILASYTKSNDFIAVTASHRGTPITINIKRGQNTKEVTLTPRLETKPGEGPVGVMLAEVGETPRPIFTAIKDGGERTLISTQAVAIGLYSLIADLVVRHSVSADVTGPVGIFSIAHKTGEMGLGYFLELLGFISINLAVLNCIPFPALDGGRVLLVLIEKIRRKALPVKFELLINGVGFAALIVALILLTFRDVARMF